MLKNIYLILALFVIRIWICVGQRVKVVNMCWSENRTCISALVRNYKDFICVGQRVKDVNLC